MTRLAIRLVIIGVVVVGGLVFRDRLSGGAQDLKVGDCFDSKHETTEIKDVQHHPCTEAHNAEVVLVTVHTAVKGSAYPSDAAFEAWADQTCVPAIVNYVAPGTGFQTLGYGIFYPNQSDWKDGERQMICYAMPAVPVTKSLHAGAS
ncbi:MAG: hypothetical protein E6J17_03110 [Chloroflexi bacterium]|nr:MAG: hypothetical protein E6J17_03110 [Chloroflexota bacterium]